MGYDIHITRKTTWLDDDGPEISREDWLALVSNDPEMRLDGFAECETSDGDALRVNHEGIAVWTAYSGDNVDGNMAWFMHDDGRITVKNPDEEILRKMWAIAQQLDAKVQGDEFELYDERGLQIEDEPQPGGRPSRSPWWAFWQR